MMIELTKKSILKYLTLATSVYYFFYVIGIGSLFKENSSKSFEYSNKSSIKVNISETQTATNRILSSNTTLILEPVTTTILDNSRNVLNSTRHPNLRFNATNELKKSTTPYSVVNKSTNTIGKITPLTRNISQPDVASVHVNSTAALLPLHVQRKIKIPIDCRKMVDENDAEEMSKAINLTRLHRANRKNRTSGDYSVSKELLDDLKMIPDENFIFDESRCDEFVGLRGYNNYTVTDEEKAFPLAFIILANIEVESLERFLRAIYRPHNAYCIHIDLKSASAFQQAVESIVRCFSNVFITTKLERIIYTGNNRTRAEINCINDLLTPPLESKSSHDKDTQIKIKKFWSHERLVGKKFSNNWKYLFNTASTEFPMRTNRELVQILTIYNGTNDIEYKQFPYFETVRFKYHWEVNERSMSMAKTNKTKNSPPFNYTMYKNLVYSTYSRAFLEYVVTDPKPRALLDWLQDTLFADESFWGTLQYNLQFKPPGSFESKIQALTFELRIFRFMFLRNHNSLLEKPTNGDYYHMSRYSSFLPGVKCDSEALVRHYICMMTNRDLDDVARQPHFMVNKFQLIDDPVAYSCMEDWYARRHQRENELTKNGTKTVINMTPYCQYLHTISCGKIYQGCEKLITKSTDQVC